MTDHPLTEARAAELWDAHREPGLIPFHAQGRRYVQDQITLLRATFDAGREHERTTASEPSARTLLGIPDTHGTPHHNVYAIRAGDFVVEVNKGGAVSGGVVHYQDADDDWFDENGSNVTWAAVRADRPDAVTVWPAPAPPAEEVALTDEPRLLTDVVLSGGEKIDEATWTGTVLLYARHPLVTHLVVAPAYQIEQWTMDGIRARRDGKHEDGTPRFVKEEEK